MTSQNNGRRTMVPPQWVNTHQLLTSDGLMDSSLHNVEYCYNERNLRGNANHFSYTQILNCASSRKYPFPIQGYIVDLKGVHANCLCASLLRTQFMLQRHATSCTSTRAKEEIYSHEGMVCIALTLLRFNSLGWLVTPTFFR